MRARARLPIGRAGTERIHAAHRLLSELAKAEALERVEAKAEAEGF